MTVLILVGDEKELALLMDVLLKSTRGRTGPQTEGLVAVLIFVGDEDEELAMLNVES
jgi:hypothetical protein